MEKDITSKLYILYIVHNTCFGHLYVSGNIMYIETTWCVVTVYKVPGTFHIPFIDEYT